MELSRKLQIKPGQSVAILNAPEGVALPDLREEALAEADAVIAFVTRRAELAELDAVLSAARADRLAWVGYPKAGKLGTDLNRDRLAEALREHGLQPVRQVAIDDTWSALRFRPAGE
jgi:hypothetical protein